MRHLLLYFVTATVILAISTTVASGQASETDRQILQKPANAKQHEWRREKPRSLFLPQKQGNVKNLRASQATALLLDSVVTQMNPSVAVEEGNQKIVYSYNAAGNVILEIEYEWNETTQAWYEYGREGYDDNGNLILDTYSYTSSYWDEETQQYVEIEYRKKYEYAYDHLNWQTLLVSYEWENEQWVGSFKNVYEYTDREDSYNQRETQYQQGTNSEWNIQYRKECTFSGRRQLLPEEEYSGDDVSDGDFPSLPKREINSDNILDYINYSYDENGNISYGLKIEYAKDADGNIILEKDYSWDTETNTWKESWKYKIEYAYNAADLLTAVRYYSWDYETDTWGTESENNSYTITYTFDGNDNVSSFTKQYVSSQNNQKVDYTYDSQNRALTAVVYYWGEYYGEERQEYKWIKEISYERGFDSYGNLILFGRSIWDDDVISYYNKYEYAYDDAGKQIMDSYIYNSDNYNSGYKYEYAYDNNGNQTLNIYSRYDSATKTFVPIYKYEYTYGDRILPDMQDLSDSGYIPLTVKHSEWDSELNDWVVLVEGKYEWTFDAANNPNTLILNVKAGNEWIWYATMTFYYSPHEVSGVAGVPASDLRVWISGNGLHVENGGANTVQVFDISGRQRLNAYLSGGQSLDVSHLPQDIYLVRVNGKTVKVFKK
jgi:hypothetical protein